MNLMKVKYTKMVDAVKSGMKLSYILSTVEFDEVVGVGKPYMIKQFAEDVGEKPVNIRSMLQYIKSKYKDKERPSLLANEAN